MFLRLLNYSSFTLSVKGTSCPLPIGRSEHFTLQCRAREEIHRSRAGDFSRAWGDQTACLSLLVAFLVEELSQLSRAPTFQEPVVNGEIRHPDHTRAQHPLRLKERVSVQRSVFIRIDRFGGGVGEVF